MSQTIWSCLLSWGDLEYLAIRTVPLCLWNFSYAWGTGSTFGKGLWSREKSVPSLSVVIFYHEDHGFGGGVTAAHIIGSRNISVCCSRISGKFPFPHFCWACTLWMHHQSSPHSPFLTDLLLRFPLFFDLLFPSLTLLCFLSCTLMVLLPVSSLLQFQPLYSGYGT